MLSSGTDDWLGDSDTFLLLFCLNEDSLAPDWLPSDVFLAGSDMSMMKGLVSEPTERSELADEWARLDFLRSCRQIEQGNPLRSNVPLVNSIEVEF